MNKQRPVEFVRSAASPRDFPSDGLPEVAVVGRSNVGKSSLLNRLTGVKKLAFVSKTPGRTQLINFFRVGSELYLADLPGYGFAKVPDRVRKNWETLISSYLFGREELKLALLLVDMRRDPMASDLQVRDLLIEAEVPIVVVATKADKLSGNKRTQQMFKLDKAFGADSTSAPLSFSAVTNEGRKELWMVIENQIRLAKRAPRT